MSDDPNPNPPANPAPPAPPPPPPPPPPNQAGTVAGALEAGAEQQGGQVFDLDSVRRATGARNEEAGDIVETCVLAGMPTLAADFVRRGMTLAAVRTDLQRRQAEAQEATQVETLNPAPPVNRDLSSGGGQSDLSKVVAERFARQMGRS